jgi:hypothetical protein
VKSKGLNSLSLYYPIVGRVIDAEIKMAGPRLICSRFFPVNPFITFSSNSTGIMGWEFRVTKGWMLLAFSEDAGVSS